MVYNNNLEPYKNNSVITTMSSWARWRLKSAASSLFTQPLIQVQIKENIKAPVTGEFPAQRASNAENVSIRWRHHGIDITSSVYCADVSVLALAVLACSTDVHNPKVQVFCRQEF